MRLNQIRSFVKIVEAGSIRAAARNEGVSHPAMTKSLRQLEDDVGIQLIRRGARGVLCTPAGRVFLSRAGVILAELRRLKEELAELGEEGGGSVSVGLSPTVAVLIAPEATARFLDDHPQARLRITEGAPSVLAPLVRDGALDFAFVFRSPATLGPALRFRVLHHGRMAVVCRRGHPLRKATALRELTEARWLGFLAPGSGSWVEQAFSAASLALPRRFVLCESLGFAFEMLARTDALMPLPAPLILPPFNRGALAEIPLTEGIPPFVIGLCSRADSRLTPLALALARSFAETTRDLGRES